jgi:hypothetical protein
MSWGYDVLGAMQETEVLELDACSFDFGSF